MAGDESRKWEWTDGTDWPAGGYYGPEPVEVWDDRVVEEEDQDDV